jgi:4-hydroxy-tetrahydrodipicolinate synthase
MLVGPYYNKPPQEGFYQHFKAIAEATKLPIIVYNVPGRTASNILPETIKRLAQIKNIVAVKEASGNLDQVSEIIRITPKDFIVYSGDDSLTLPILALGGAGNISVAGHIVGKKMQKMISAFENGNLAEAQSLHQELLPFFKVIFITTNPIPIKTAVTLIGQNAGPLRLPLVAPAESELVKIKQVMHEVGVL